MLWINEFKLNLPDTQASFSHCGQWCCLRTPTRWGCVFASVSTALPLRGWWTLLLVLHRCCKYLAGKWQCGELKKKPVKEGGMPFLGSVFLDFSRRNESWKILRDDYGPGPSYRYFLLTAYPWRQGYFLKKKIFVPAKTPIIVVAVQLNDIPRPLFPASFFEGVLPVQLN